MSDGELEKATTYYKVVDEAYLTFTGAHTAEQIIQERQRQNEALVDDVLRAKQKHDSLFRTDAMQEGARL